MSVANSLPEFADPLPKENGLSESDEAVVWGYHPTLHHIFGASRARQVSPWFTLACTLARITSAVGPHVRHPAVVGGVVAINQYVIGIGSSGAGKDAAYAVSRDAVRIEGEGRRYPIGTGEGMVSVFKRAKASKTEQVDTWLTRTAVFWSGEIDKLKAVAMERSGATLMTTLREAWMGGQLGGTTRSIESNVSLDELEYRLCIVFAAQPQRCAALFGEQADGGTPQRFVWFGAHDRDAPEPDFTAPLPRVVDPISVRIGRAIAMPERPDGELPREVLIDLPEVAVHEIVMARSLNNRGLAGGDPALDGHALLARSKLAYSLALLCGQGGGRADRTGYKAEHWELAGIVMRQSDAVRSAVQEVMAEQERTANEAKARAGAHKQLVADDERERVLNERVIRPVMKVLEDADGRWVRGSILIQKCKHGPVRDRFNAVMVQLANTGQIEREQYTNKANGKPAARYRIPS